MESYNNLEDVVNAVMSQRLPAEIRVKIISGLLLQYPAPALVETLANILSQYQQYYEERIISGCAE